MVTIQCSINSVKDAKIFLHISGEDLINEIFKKNDCLISYIQNQTCMEN